MKSSAMLSRILLLFLVVLPFTCAYLPGVRVIDWQRGEQIPVKVNKLTSTKTQLPYGYYQLPFPQPDVIVPSVENLGEVLRGDRIENSLYKVNALEAVYNQVVPCSGDSCKYSYSKLKQFQEKIEDQYAIHLIMDNLPSATKLPTGQYLLGFRLGTVADGKVFLNNHWRFIIKYHDPTKPDPPPAGFESTSCRIVGFEVEPYSIQREWEIVGQTVKDSSNSANHEGMIVSGRGKDQTVEIIWTYDVIWEESPVLWASRWNAYMMPADQHIHWFSIVNSLMIVLFLTGMVAMIVMRTLHQDFNRYNKLDGDDEESQDETGWKLVHADVFRPPQWANLLCVLCGTGAQLFTSSIVTIVFAALGLLNPSYRGSTLVALLLLFVFMGVLAGYLSARMFKSLRGTEWKQNTLWTAFLFPSVIFIIFFIINIFLWSAGSSQGVGFVELLELMLMWFGISVPLVFVGAYMGFKKEPWEFPVRTNQIPRQIPAQSWYMGPTFSIIVGGVLPFGTVFIEMFFVLSSLWQHEIYYLFGFLLIVFCILIVTCAEITIVLCYFQLCAEDYHWWWRSFLTSGASAFYLFLYCGFYFFTRLTISEAIPTIIYFGYSLILALVFFVVTGTIGCMACFWFCMKIYANIKVD